MNFPTAPDIPLSPNKLTTLKDYITRQASDGWGEGFEQREIRVDGGELLAVYFEQDVSHETYDSMDGERYTGGGQ